MITHIVEKSASEIEWLEHLLCQCCRYLTKYQILEIKGIDGYVDLYDWYRNHLLIDAFYYLNKNDPLESEHFKIGLDKLTNLSDKEKKNRGIDEINRIRNELKKLGYNIILKKDETLVERFLLDP